MKEEPPSPSCHQPGSQWRRTVLPVDKKEHTSSPQSSKPPHAYTTTSRCRRHIVQVQSRGGGAPSGAAQHKATFAKTQVASAYVFVDPTLAEAWAIDWSKTTVESDASPPGSAHHPTPPSGAGGVRACPRHSGRRRQVLQGGGGCGGASALRAHRGGQAGMPRRLACLQPLVRRRRRIRRWRRCR